MRLFVLAIIFIISGLVFGVGLGTTAMAFNDYTKTIMEKDCTKLNLPQWKWSALDMWCATLDNQQKIIEQNDRLIELQEQTNCLLIWHELNAHGKESRCE